MCGIRADRGHGPKLTLKSRHQCDGVGGEIVADMITLPQVLTTPMNGLSAAATGKDTVPLVVATSNE
jgi:hypothetical protein